MMNLRPTKVNVRPERVLPAAAVVAAAAAIALVLAQGAAARPTHHPEPGQVTLEHNTLHVRGTEANDAIALRLAAGDSTVVQVDLGDNGSADFSFPRAEIQKIRVEGRGGDDSLRIDDTNGAFTNTIPTRIAGGPGSDTIEGGPGADTMLFNGAGASETVDLSTNGNRLRFFRNPVNINMNTHGVETVDFNALGGADAITVNDLSGTDVKSVNLDLAGTLGGTTGDGQTDRVHVIGTNGNDALSAAGDSSGVTVSGLQTQIAIQHQEPTDQLFVQGVGGDDNISATG